MKVLSPEVQEALYRMFLQAIPGIPYFRYVLGSYNYLEEIRNLTVSYCILKGNLDRDINLFLKSTKIALEYQRNKTGLPSGIIELPDAGHMTNMDAPDCFNNALRDWIQTLE